MKKKIKTVVAFLLNPRFLFCFGIAWMITNGWSYVFFALGTYFGIGWMAAVGGAYLAFLWLPISPEKIVTTLIAMALLRLFFPQDEKTLGILRSLYEKYIAKRREKKQRKNEERRKSPEENEKNG